MTTYLASFDVATDGALGTITLSTAGKSSIAVDLTAVSDTTAGGMLTTTLWNHYSVGLGQNTGEDLDGTTTCADVFSDISFAARLEEMLEAAASLAAWTSYTSISVTYDPTTNRYTIAYSAANFGIDFSKVLGRRLLGYGSLTYSGAQTYTGSKPPNYTVECTLDAVSMPTPNYEPGGIATQAVSGTAAFFGLTRGCVPLFRDWVQQFEVTAKVMRLSAEASEHPFTLQELFERSRADRPFVVYDGNFATNSNVAEVFVLRADGSSLGLDAIMYAADMDGTQYHVSFRTLVLGFPQEAGGG